MFAKVFTLAAFVAITVAQYHGHQGQLGQQGHHEQHDEHVDYFFGLLILIYEPTDTKFKHIWSELSNVEYTSLQYTLASVLKVLNSNESRSDIQLMRSQWAHAVMPLSAKEKAVQTEIKIDMTDTVEKGHQRDNVTVHCCPVPTMNNALKELIRAVNSVSGSESALPNVRTQTYSDGVLFNDISFNETLTQTVETIIKMNVTLDDPNTMDLVPNKTSVGSVFESKLIIPLYVIIFLLSVIGNTLVLVTLAQNKRMRTVTNVYLLNLYFSNENSPDDEKLERRKQIARI
ncbi:Cholecystokinin-like receptor at 17D1 [Carabus blaptoides fortunei]